jgi:hypothetical protein
MGHICAWEGCPETFRGDMPKGWTWLLSYWNPLPINRVEKIPEAHWYRDACLCPAHLLTLERQLKNLGREVFGPPQGSA